MIKRLLDSTAGFHVLNKANVFCFIQKNDTLDHVLHTYVYVCVYAYTHTYTYTGAYDMFERSAGKVNKYWKGGKFWSLTEIMKCLLYPMYVC